MAWQVRAAASPRVQPHALVQLASRMLLAQGGASALIGFAYSRRNAPWLLITVVAAIVVCALAGVVRSGNYGAWLAAVTVEAVLVATGVIRFAYVRYMGGSLLAIVSLGVLLHPTVAGAFGRVRQRQPGELPAAIDGGGRSVDSRLATILTQGIPPEGAALPRERA
jgi:hypothetical protein